MSIAKKPLQPHDFPRKQDGTPIANTDDPAIAADVAARLNEERNNRSFGRLVAYFFPEGGVTGSGPRGETLIGDSGSVGAISAPASFTALKVVPGGFSGGRLSMIRFVWFTRSRTAAETTATIAAITTGFRRAIPIPVNGHLSRGVPALEGSRYLQKVAGPKETAN
jgi:hypothetical protein